MIRDFSIRAYEELLKEIKRTRRQVFTLDEYLMQRQAPPPVFFILRHDVDRRPGRALRMAFLEESHGIRSTYYFRHKPGVFEPSIVERIASMGHEVGYHYEVLDKARGSVPLAGHIFTRELARLRSVADVRTAAMHGNPISRWDNRDFWAYHAPSEFGLSGEAYISIRDREIVYATDTGGGWNRGHDNVFDRFPPESLSAMPPLGSTWELMRVLRQGRFPKIYLQVHPNRWTSGSFEGRVQRAEDLLLNVAKRLLAPAWRRRPDR